ncbi:MAG: crossover junction endodeoxyribonuclease RuvC [Phycisphaerae bacterium]|jgi:crossover junction endodeoxyribonuclease RuvC|nr:crossover junction endodeoxyribonuclease RuvC [Phycisphaerae bacterium]|tara:strand:+ start:477 stop:971 length:495 start_codon:yes stop_codon:yes gene_type:complete
MDNAKPLRVLGIDPGLRVAGYGCVTYARSNPRPALVEAGAIRLDTSQSISHRLLQLWKDITEIINDVSPDIVAVETVFSHARQVGTAITMGHARGVILLAVEAAELPLVELAPAEIKKSITGNGRSTKEQIQMAIAHLLGLKEVPEPPDVADALAIAITGAMRN